MTGAKPLDTTIGTFSDDQLDRVMHAFGATPFWVLPFLSVNDEIIDLRRRTETARKAIIEHEGQALFLKELPWYCADVEFAAFQQRFQNGLRQHGIPVPDTLNTLDGTGFFHDRQTGSLFTLQLYTDAAVWDGSPWQVEAAGRMLARLHTVSATVELPRLPAMRNVFGSASALISLLHDGWTGPGREDVHDLADSAMNVVERCHTDAINAGYGRVVLGVHGDYNPFNLLFDTGERSVVGVVDFDNACVDDPAHDLGEAVVRFAWMRYRGLSSMYGEVPETFDQAAIDCLLTSYTAADNRLLDHCLPILAEVITAVSLELAAIGLLSSYYTADDLPQLRHNTLHMREMARDALSRYRSGR